MYNIFASTAGTTAITAMDFCVLVKRGCMRVHRVFVNAMHLTSIAVCSKHAYMRCHGCWYGWCMVGVDDGYAAL